MNLRKVANSINQDVILEVLREDVRRREEEFSHRTHPFRIIVPEFICLGCGRWAALVLNERKEERVRYYTDSGRILGHYSPVNVWHHACVGEPAAPTVPASWWT
jgi:hypothetical protein